MSEHQTAAELIQQGLVHHRAGQISLAMDRYTQVLRNDPQNADALYYMALLPVTKASFSRASILRAGHCLSAPGRHAVTI